MLNRPAVTYNQLNAAQRGILQSKRFSGSNLSVPALITLLAPLARFDEKGDHSRATTKKLLMGSIIATVGAGFLLAMSGGAALVLPLPLAGAGIAIGAGLRYRRLRSLDLSNNLRQVVVPLLAVLREEVDPAVPITLELDLRAPISPDKLVHEAMPRAGGGYYKIVDRFYKDAWMSVQAELVGGGRLGWTIVDDVLEQKKTKRNPRGKVKTKTKYKKRTELAVTLALPQGAFTVDGAASRGGRDDGRIQIKSGDKRHTIKVARAVKGSSLEPTDPALLIELLATAYRSAAPAPAREPPRRQP